MASRPKRESTRRSLRPPALSRFGGSSSQASSSRDEISVKNNMEKAFPVVEFSSQAVPQPFLDPSAIERRIQAEKQWKLDQERISEQRTGSSSSQAAPKK